MCRLSESTTLMTRSGATWRAIRHVPGPRPVRRLDRRPPQQPDRLGLLTVQLGVLQLLQHHQRVSNQLVHQLLAPSC